MTKIIIHRVNKIAELKKIPKKFGVEIDIRSFNNEIVLAHDPFKSGDLLKKYLKEYDHAILVANIKEAGIEDLVLKEIKKKKIKNFFLLDVEFPYLYKASKNKKRNIAIRFSEDESIETVKKYINKINYVWIDTFTKLPINETNIRVLNNFHKCLVSPDRWKRSYDISKYIKRLNRSKIKIDSVMTSYKFKNIWQKLLKIKN